MKISGCDRSIQYCKLRCYKAGKPTPNGYLQAISIVINKQRNPAQTNNLRVCTGFYTNFESAQRHD